MSFEPGHRRARRAAAIVTATLSCLGLLLSGPRGAGKDARAYDAPSPTSAATAALPSEPPPAPPTSLDHVWLEPAPPTPPVVVYPPSDVASKRPLVVMLHGMCDTPDNECGAFRGAAGEAGWLVCPRANQRCPNGGSMWSGSSQTKQALVDATIAEVDRRFPDRIDHHEGAVLVGFSMGAYMAMDLAHHQKGRWSSLILIGAKVEPDPDRLRDAGVGRVLLASGDYDGARPAMQRAATRLQAAGIDAKFVSLGKVAHQFAPDMDAWMRGALSWARGG